MSAKTVFKQQTAFACSARRVLDWNETEPERTQSLDLASEGGDFWDDAYAEADFAIIERRARFIKQLEAEIARDWPTFVAFKKHATKTNGPPKTHKFNTSHS